MRISRSCLENVPMVPFETVDAAYEAAVLVATDQARQRAIDFASGRGLLAPCHVARCDSGDEDEWEGVPTHPELPRAEARRKPCARSRGCRLANGEAVVLGSAGTWV